MVGKRVYIGDELCAGLAGGGTTDASGKWDAQATVAALIGTDGQLTGLNLTIETGPMIKIKGVVQLTAHCRHGTYPVLTVDELFNGAQDECIAFLTCLVRGIQMKGF